jgi:hypothetical protein
MKALISNPLNETQRAFNELCEKGGGVRGGPARGKVLEVLCEGGQALNRIATQEVANQFAALPEVNPWHVCFAFGLSWGHLAKLDQAFTEAAVGVLADWNAADLKTACSFHWERGAEPIQQSLAGAHLLFEKVTLPAALPTTLSQLSRALERWLSPVLCPTNRTSYLGAWNATAMFMVALFAQPALAATHKNPPPILPPGGPIHAGFALLHRAGILSAGPAGTGLDDASFEPGVLYENNELFAELCRQRSDWSLIDVHSGVYMLGTRHPHSGTWT